MSEIFTETPGEKLTAETAGQAARGALEAAIREHLDGDCPDVPLRLKCESRAEILMDLADDYAATGGLDSTLADDYAKLRKERDGLRGQLQAVGRLMADAAANGIIDSGAIVALLDAMPAAQQPQPAPELRAALAETRQLREQLADVLGWFCDNGSGHYARVSGTVLAREYKRAALAVPDKLKHPGAT